MRVSLAQLNRLPDAEFVRVVGGIFEQSPWIASAVVARRPFASRKELLTAMISLIEDSSSDKLLELLRAHPDLAARLEEVTTLTAESQNEQRSAGLLDLSPTVAEELRSLLKDYRQRFGFPFIICARLNNLESILAAIRQRIHCPAADELANAWGEVQKIAALRLADILVED
jgi:2-oxo-4-hydroxy-4-carboxy-5-ureidoimidazoline decarboxylase